MDISELCTADAHEEGAELIILHPLTRKPTDLKIRIKGVDSKGWRKARKGIEKAMLSQMVSGGEVDGDAAEIEALAAITIGWDGLVKDGKPLKFSGKACKELYTAAPNVRDQVDRFVGNRANFTQGLPESS